MLTSESALRKDRTSAKGPSLEHRHFAVIAGVISDFGYPQERQRIAEEFARKLAATNPRFDRGRFLKACGVES